MLSDLATDVERMARIVTLQSSTGWRVRVRLLAEVARATGAQAGLWYSVDADGIIVQWATWGSRALNDAVARLAGTRVPSSVRRSAGVDDLLLALSAARAHDRQDFRWRRPHGRRPPGATAAGPWDALCVTAGATDILRALPISARRSLGWFGVVRLDGSRFRLVDRASARGLYTNVRSGLEEAAQLERIGDISYLLLGDDGRVERGCRGALRWSTDERRELMRDAVSNLARSANSQVRAASR